MKASYTNQIIPALLILLFTYTAVSKLSDFSFFKAQLLLYPYIQDIAAFIAISIPVLEVITAGLLFFPITRLWGLYASCFLLLIFTAYLSVMVATQRDLPCSCGGVIQKMSWQQHIAFNLFFILLSLLGIRIEMRPASSSVSDTKTSVNTISTG